MNKFGKVVGAALMVLTTAGLIVSEGVETRAYRDIVGIPTGCVGETEGVRMGQTWTREECVKKLERRVVQFDKELGRCVHVAVPEEVRSAFIQWSYNVGTGAACGSTAVRKLNAGDTEGACNALMAWNKARVNGKLQEVRGLTLRRERERDLCLSGLDKDAP